MEKEKIEKLLLSIIEKIEKRDDLLIELTKEIARKFDTFLIKKSL